LILTPPLTLFFEIAPPQIESISPGVAAIRLSGDLGAISGTISGPVVRVSFLSDAEVVRPGFSATFDEGEDPVKIRF